MSFARFRSARLAAVLGLLFVGLIYMISVGGPGGHRTPPAALVSLVRNRDMANTIEMVRNVEDRYNRRFNHDWVFLSEENINPEFIDTVSAFVSGGVKFLTVDRKAHWTVPSHIDREQLDLEMQALSDKGVPYGGSVSYRLMCRFQAGFFMDYLREYRYYARIDPDVKLYCDMDTDFFATMHRLDKKLGFTISLKEVPHAVNRLPAAIDAFAKANQDLVHPNGCVDDFIMPRHGFCHFWSNFEVGDLEFFRSPAYRKLFETLDEDGGFFYNRWGDAPVHSIAAALLLDRKDLHYFGDIGMYHRPNMNCPPSQQERLRLRCSCPNDKTLGKHDRTPFTYHSQSCTPRFLNMTGEPFQQDWTFYADKDVSAAFDPDGSAAAAARDAQVARARQRVA